MAVAVRVQDRAHFTERRDDRNPAFRDYSTESKDTRCTLPIMLLAAPFPLRIMPPAEKFRTSSNRFKLLFQPVGNGRRRRPFALRVVCRPLIHLEGVPGVCGLPSLP